MSEITGQFSYELARLYQTDKLLWAISSLDVHHHRHKMALFKKFILLPPLRSPESFYATYRGPWLLVKKWPLVYLQTTKKAPKSVSVARTDSAITICLPKFLWGHKNRGQIVGSLGVQANPLYRLNPLYPLWIRHCCDLGEIVSQI